MPEYNCGERRAINDGNDKLIIFRLDQIDKKLERTETSVESLKLDTTQKVADVVKDLSVMKNEMLHIAKEAGKSAGIISGIGMGIISTLISVGISILIKGN